MFLFDIDHFKHYNDNNGHIAGDQALRVLAQLVQVTVRADDVFGRFGGEEFLLIMPNRSPAQALSAAGNILQRIERYDFPFGKGQPMGKVTVNGGVATFPDDSQDAVDLLLSADNALYRAKQQGRNRVFRAETGLKPQPRPSSAVLDDSQAGPARSAGRQRNTGPDTTGMSPASRLCPFPSLEILRDCLWVFTSWGGLEMKRPFSAWPHSSNGRGHGLINSHSS